MKILVLANCGMGLYKFRKELLKELISRNNEVYISLPKDEYISKLQELGCKVIDTHIDRRGTNPLKDLQLLFFYIKTIKNIKPDLVLTYTIKPNVYGGIASRITNIPYLANVTGLGTSIENKGLLQKFVLGLYRIGLKKAACVFFQNEPNRQFFIDNNIVGSRTRLIPGSGVNLEEHTFEEYPEEDDRIKFLFVGRIMKAKGIDELLGAAKKVKELYENVQFDLVGYIEENYLEKLTEFEELGIIKFHGQQDAVHSFIKNAHATILPSYHEGTANVLLESASSGRPVLASRVTGCIETFEEEVSGLGFEVKNAESLVETILRFIKLPHDEKKAMGINGRRKMEKEFDRRFVIDDYVEEINNVKGYNMDLYERIVNGYDKISLVGLGYVGMPIAVAFAKKVKVIGFDINSAKIDLYRAGIDPTYEVGNEIIKNTTVEFTSKEEKLRDAKFHIVAVPTPVNADHTPDLAPVKSACSTLGRNLTKGSIVVFESTVYPGVTEDICVPILERESGLKCGEDFKVGYSPERINPGDKVHRLETIVKIVSGMDSETLDTIAKVYEIVVEAGVYRAQSIKVAEAAKVIENSQRDINIAFMNELSIIFNKMNIDTKAVLEAAETKWNFLKFYPGLVGGHCIGVDPYYLTYKAEEMGYHSQVILSGRKINDDMGKYVAENTVKKMIKANKQINGSKVAVFGMTFKENCPDVRNTKVVDIINELEEYGVEVKVVEPVADREELWCEYGINSSKIDEITDIDAIIFAVSHDEFKTLKLEDIKKMFKAKAGSNSEVEDETAEEFETKLESEVNRCVLIDVKGMFHREEAEQMGYLYWRL